MSSPFSLHPVTPNDIPAMTSIFTAAFANDTNTQLKLVGKDPNSQADGMAMGIRQWLNYPDRITLLKAVETSTGAMMGWVGWARRGFGDQTVPSIPKDEEENTTTTTTTTTAKAIESQLELEPGEKKMDNAAKLEDMSDLDMNRWISKIMPPGTRCRYLTSCLVHPSYQGRSVGTALIHWGVEKADEDGVFCWVHSSDGAEGFYERCGFEEVERFVVDLDGFADGPRDGVEGSKWGKYVFRYMIRQPMTRES
ncbi:hypothetical protein Vi05172_g2941 [Venturia inaequalis]|uniref:N-acetyltransferase domain-containing protein n=1 Tax=Venturia inaequalis TaxID=5025 RepID=A0A8H3VK47_VENIN|nr:hypothetical protein EG327_002652 [Venturia inaequalis]RDI87042.1 hypothetical protein Vi05172_g2941 [Venturia inaequalis]